jgi:hypothetical protein
MNGMRIWFVVILFLSAGFLNGCAVGPLVQHDTARTVGKGNNEFVGGIGQAGFVAKWNYGLTDKWDFGVQWESFSLGLRTKYAFIDDNDGWSFAGAVGTGASVGGSHYYADLLGSYLVKSWEPYGTLRFVRVKTDPVEFKDENTGTVDFTVNSSSYGYGQAILGTRYWFNAHWLVSAEVSSLFSMSSDLKIGSGVLVGIAGGYRFH